MKKLLAVLLLVSSSAFAWDQRPNFPVDACKVHSPYGFAQTKKAATPLCREGYLSAWDSTAKIPVYVAYTLTPANAIGCFPRTNAFVADKNAPGSSVPDDYAGTGYDKGHMAPAADFNCTTDMLKQTFSYLNCALQNQYLNRGVWKLLEAYERELAKSDSVNVKIIVVFDKNSVVLPSGAHVPSGFYKIITLTKANKIIKYYFPNEKPTKKTFDEYKIN